MKPLKKFYAKLFSGAFAAAKRDTSHSDEKRKEEIVSSTVKIEEICNSHHHHESGEISGFREGKIVEGGTLEDRQSDGCYLSSAEEET